MLPVGSSGGDAFILFNKGLICFYNQYKCEGTSKSSETEGFCRGQKPKDNSIKILAFFQKKRKTKPHHLQKAKLIRKRNTGGTVSLDLGVSLQFLTCQRRPSHDQLYCAETRDFAQMEATPTGTERRFLSLHSST